MILASVYNLHEFGLVLGLIELLIGTTFIYLIFREKQKPSNSNGAAYVEASINDATTEPLPTSNKSKYSKGIPWCTFFTFTIIMGLVAFARLLSLCMRMEWRNDLGSKFPDSCGDWAESDGCTRISLYKDGCTRAKSIPDKYSIMYGYGVSAEEINHNISECVDRNLSGGKIIYPDDLSRSKNPSK